MVPSELPIKRLTVVEARLREMEVQYRYIKRDGERNRPVL